MIIRKLKLTVYPGNRHWPRGSVRPNAICRHPTGTLSWTVSYGLESLGGPWWGLPWSARSGSGTPCRPPEPAAPPLARPSWPEGLRAPSVGGRSPAVSGQRSQQLSRLHGQMRQFLFHALSLAARKASKNEHMNRVLLGQTNKPHGAAPRDVSREAETVLVTPGRLVSTVTHHICLLRNFLWHLRSWVTVSNYKNTWSFSAKMKTW